MSSQAPDPDGERLDEMLFLWHQEWDRSGRSIAPEDLCRDSPDLLPEVTRRLKILQRIEALFEVSGITADATSSHTSEPARPSGQRALEAGPLPRLPGYEVLAEIGHGGMGIIYKARHVALNRMEAIKTTRAGEFAGPKDLARFRFEAEAAAGLRHPNIVPIYGVGESRSGPYLAMQWVDGKSLAEQRPESARAIATVMAKIARAVHFAHQRGILHRDLKPQNVLIDAAGEPPVADFGIARRLGADATLTQAGSPIGTPAYMSPEQARGEPNLRVVSDVYSLGVILYELLAGRLPFTGGMVDILRKVQSDEAPPEPRRVNPAADPDLEAVCLRCLEKDADHRYQTANDLADELERFLRGDPVTARPPGLWEWLRQLARTRPEPSANYSWPVTVWFGFLVLISNATIAIVVRYGGSALSVWAANIAGAAGMLLALWYYMLRRFRHLPPTERHSLIIAAGHVSIVLTMTATYVPLSVSASARTALVMYPALAAVSGLGLFTLGSTNWSRFFLIGFALIALAPLLAHWPEAAPLLYGGVIAAVMWYWSYVKKVIFSRPAGDGLTIDVPPAASADSCQG